MQQEELVFSIEYFDFLHAFFADKDKYARIADNVKLSYCWRLYRTLAIHYPKQIQNYQNVRTVEMIDFLQRTMFTGQVPGWSKTANLKEDTDPNFKYNQVPIQLKELLAKQKNIELKSLDQAYKFWPAKTLKELDDIRLMTEQQSKKKTARK